jgi:hypothetical protein
MATMADRAGRDLRREAATVARHLQAQPNRPYLLSPPGASSILGYMATRHWSGQILVVLVERRDDLPGSPVVMRPYMMGAEEIEAYRDEFLGRMLTTVDSAIRQAGVVPETEAREEDGA